MKSCYLYHLQKKEVVKRIKSQRHEKARNILQSEKKCTLVKRDKKSER